MARALHLNIPGGSLHVVNRGVERRTIFPDEASNRFLSGASRSVPESILHSDPRLCPDGQPLSFAARNPGGQPQSSHAVAQSHLTEPGLTGDTGESVRPEIVKQEKQGVTVGEFSFELTDGAMKVSVLLTPSSGWEEDLFT